MKNWFSRNIGLKIISVLIAILFWIIINGMTDPITTVTIKDIPVKLLNEESMASVSKIFEVVSGDTINVKVRTRRSVAENLSAGDFLATADILDKTELNAIEIVVSCTAYSEDELEILEKKTEDGTGMMKLALEDADTQSFAVSVVPNGVVADGYYITENTVSPNLITISGSRTQIAKIAKIAVMVNVEGAKRSFQQTSTPVAYDLNGNVIDAVKLTMSAEEVLVDMTLLPTKEISVNVLTDGTPNSEYICTGVEYAPHKITIAGEEQELEHIQQIAVYCNVAGAAGDVEEDINIEEILKERFGSLYVLVDENEYVSAKATIIPKTYKEIPFLNSSIELIGLAEGLVAEYPEVSSSIRISGTESDVQKVTASALNPYIDCTTITGPGTYIAIVRTADFEGVTAAVTTVEVDILRQETAEPAPTEESDADGEAE